MQSSMQSSIQRGCNEISVYDDEPASREHVKTEAKKLMAAFPDVSNDFIILLIDRITDNNFTKKRVKDAIAKVIDSNPYRRPSIADIISFDQKIRFYTHKEIEAKAFQGASDIFENYERIEINGKWRYIEK